MASPIFSFCSFHAARLWRTQPRVFSAVAASLVVVLLSAFVFFQQWQQADAAMSKLQQLASEVRRKPVAVVSEKKVSVAALDLPSFSSAELVDTINQVALDTGIPVNEVSYRLDEGANFPYLRYRVTLTITAKYPLMRGFIDQVATSLPHSALDEVTCARNDIQAAMLNCDLSFSAFFRKDGHG